MAKAETKPRKKHSDWTLTNLRLLAAERKFYEAEGRRLAAEGVIKPFRPAKPLKPKK